MAVDSGLRGTGATLVHQRPSTTNITRSTPMPPGPRLAFEKCYPAAFFPLIVRVTIIDIYKRLVAMPIPRDLSVTRRASAAARKEFVGRADTADGWSASSSASTRAHNDHNQSISSLVDDAPLLGRTVAAMINLMLSRSAASRAWWMYSTE